MLGFLFAVINLNIYQHKIQKLTYASRWYLGVNDSRIDQQMSFIIELDKLKDINRHSYISSSVRRENSAEHSWHVSVMALILSEYAEPLINKTKVMRMLLLHDIVEILAGDTFCYDGENLFNESEAAKSIFGLLPRDQRDDCILFWKEFVANESVESQFANSLNKLMPLLQNYHTKGKLWKEKGITSSMVFSRNKSMLSSSPKLWKYAKHIIELSIAKGYLDVD